MSKTRRSPRRVFRGDPTVRIEYVALEIMAIKPELSHLTCVRFAKEFIEAVDSKVK